MLDVLLDEIMSGSLVAPVADDDGRTPDYLAFVAIGVQLAETSVLAQLHVIRDGQQGDLMFLAQGLDKFLVRSFVAVLG